MARLKKIHVKAKGFCFRSTSPTICGGGADIREDTDKYSGFRILLTK